MSRKRLQSPERRKRRPGILPTVGLVVEGDAEFAALPRLAGVLKGCPPLKAINLRGVGADVAPQGIAKQIAPKIVSHWAAGRSKVVVCIDRETRGECCPQFAAQVRAATDLALDNYAADGHYHVVIADRSFEAWLLAGAAGLHRQRLFKRQPSHGSFEGLLGAEQKKGCVELEQLLEREYSKTSDGPRLFAALDFAAARDRARGGSRSLDKLLRSIGV